MEVLSCIRRCLLEQRDLIHYRVRHWHRAHYKVYKHTSHSCIPIMNSSFPRKLVQNQNIWVLTSTDSLDLVSRGLVGVDGAHVWIIAFRVRDLDHCAAEPTLGGRPGSRRTAVTVCALALVSRCRARRRFFVISTGRTHFEPPALHNTWKKTKRNEYDATPNLKFCWHPIQIIWPYRKIVKIMRFTIHCNQQLRF